jgi:hypothetical protein
MDSNEKYFVCHIENAMEIFCQAKCARHQMQRTSRRDRRTPDRLTPDDNLTMRTAALRRNGDVRREC